MNNIFKSIKKIIYSIIFIFATLMVIVIGFLPFIGSNINHRRCVQLENGLNIGCNAVFDLSRPYFYPYGVPKFPDGTPLVDQPLWSVFVTDTSIYGRTFGKPGKAAFDFAWRADTGLVRQKEDRETYDRLVAEAGQANVGIGTGSCGPLIVMEAFMKRPEYADQWCSTKLFTW